MVTYTTKFPVNELFDKEAFVKTVIKWNQGSKFDKIDNIIWDNQNYECEWIQDNISLRIQEVESESIVASRLRKEDEHGVWQTDFVLNVEQGTLAISVSLETTELTTDFLPTYYPPFFVKMVIFGEYAGTDNGILVQNKAHLVSECSEFIKSIVSQTSISRLPVVYIMGAIEDTLSIDVNELAFRLQGVAHVITDQEECQDEDLSMLLGNLEGHNGKIHIFYPSHNKKIRTFNLTGISIESDYLQDRIVNDVYNYMNSRMRKAIDTWDGVSTEKLHIINRKLLSDHNAIEEENRYLYDIYEEQLRRMEESNNRLSNDVQRLTAELQGLRMRYADKEQAPIIYLGKERELYTGEIKEIVLEILLEYQKNCKEGSRRWHIISDLLESNEYKGLPEKRRELLKNALKGYKSLNGSLKSVLETLGFEISDDGKHYKWTYYGDHRYVATAAKTSSDGRSGMNLSSIIDKLMF